MPGPAETKSLNRNILNILTKDDRSNKIRLTKLSNQLLVDTTTLKGALREFAGNNLVELDRHGRIINKLPKNTYFGTIYTTATGSGFVKTENNETFYIPKPFMKNAIYQDTVLISPLANIGTSKTPEAMILAIVEHKLNKVVGTLIPSENQRFAFVVPDDKRINFDLYVGKNYINGAQPYDKVVAEIVKFPTRIGKRPSGNIIEVLGLKGEKESEELSVIRNFNLPEKFPPAVQKEESLFNGDSPQKWDLSHRIDCRDKLVVTMDCDTSKDLDDAFSVVKTENGYELGVYIADVAHYVRENSAIDKEAFKRGNSVYFFNQVIPMLPTILSNNLCSLNPREDKLVLAVIMNINNNGEVTDFNISEGVINSAGRLNYTESTNFLNGFNDDFRNKHGNDIADMLIISRELADILMQKRIRRGAIEFDIHEPELIFDENGKCIEIRPEKRGISNDIIEEFMLCANEVVAKFLSDNKLPGIFRIHPSPFSSKIENFIALANSYNIECSELNVDEITPGVLQKFIEKLSGTDMEIPVKMQLLQSMQQARYSEIRSPHFSLASNYYCHFTSPIRRYPDLIVHRIIKLYLRGSFCNEALTQKYIKICSEAASQCSKTERVAERAEEEATQIKIFEYISEHMEDEYTAMVKNLNKIGIFIMLDNSLEGFIKDKSYKFNKESFSADICGKNIKIGDKIKVRVVNINKNSKEIMFQIIEQ